jgi:hypothetical protein
MVAPRAAIVTTSALRHAISRLIRFFIILDLSFVGCKSNKFFVNLQTFSYIIWFAT